MSRIRILFTVAVLSAAAALWLVARTSMPAPSPAFGAPSAPPLPEIEAGTGSETLRGRLLDAAGAAVPEAFVEARAGDLLHWSYTDAEGRFELGRLLAGAVELDVVAEGYAPATFAAELPAAGELDFALEAPRPPIELLPSIPRSDLAARARSADGASTEGWELVLTPDAEADPLEGAVQRRERLGADGGVTVYGLAHASYRAELLPPWAAGGDWPVLASASWTQPGQAPELALEAAPARVSGHLVDPQARPLIGALVLLHDLADARHVWPPGRTDGEGAFRVEHLPPGRYSLRLLAGTAEHALEIEVAAGDSKVLPLLSLDPKSAP